MSHTTEEMNNLRDLLEQKLLKVIKPGSRVYYIDYPLYGNIGDILIAKGTEAYFQKYRIEVLGRASVVNYCFALTPPDCIIVFQGGGNFGDLYVSHQSLREKVIRRFPDRKIVILPQTIHFKNAKSLQVAAEVFRKHGDLHLFVRDHHSLELAKQFSKHCVLCPDMAHALWPVNTLETPRHPTLFLLRSDHEAVSYDQVFSGGPLKDWETVLAKTDKYLMRYLRQFHKLNRLTNNTWPDVYHYWRIFTDKLVTKAIREFSRYEKIVTSRLHGHILACLLSKPNYLIDNSYGKNLNYYQTWTCRVPDTRLGWTQ